VPVRRPDAWLENARRLVITNRVGRQSAQLSKLADGEDIAGHGYRC